jgi:predicted flap endonuclease-1-like 5' DNA nuclease
MALKEIVEKLDLLIIQRKFVELGKTFTQNSVKTAVNCAPAMLTQFPATSTIMVLGQLYDKDTSVSEFEFVSSGHDGAFKTSHGLLRRNWSGGLIIEEQFYTSAHHAPTLVAMPLENTNYKHVPFDITVERTVPVERVTERIVEVPVDVERIVHVMKPIEKITERIIEVEVPVERIVRIMKPVERIVEVIEEVEVTVEKIIQKIRPVEVIKEVFIDVPIERIVERINPIVTTVEHKIDVHYDRIVERINPIENVIEHKVDVRFDRIIERINPIENIVERKFDVKFDRIIERINPVETIVERFIDVPVERIVERQRPMELPLAPRVVVTPAPMAPILRPKPVFQQKRDDLKIVEGIGPKIEQLFHGEGIYTFAALSDLQPDWIRDMLKKAGPRYAIHNPETWPQQSQLAAEGRMDELQVLQDRLSAGRPE